MVKTIGETQKRMKDFVVGGTQFLMNKTERLSTSFMQYMNGDGEQNASRSNLTESVSRSTLTESASTASLTGMQKPRLRIETQSIPILEETSSDEAEKVYEVRDNVDEDSSDSADADHVAGSLC